MKNIFRKQNSDGSTGSVAMLLAVGSKGLAYELRKGTRRKWRFGKRSLHDGPARNRELSITSGTGSKPASFSTGWSTPEQPGDYSVRSSSNIGQEILDRDGKVVVWTTDAVLAHRITSLLNSE